MNVDEWLDNALKRRRNTSALVIHGPQESGKGIAVNLFEKLSDKQHVIRLTSGVFSRDKTFNIISNAVTEADVVVFDECDIESVKPLISARDIQVEMKGRYSEIKPVKANLILTPISKPILQDDERRFILTTPLEVIAILTRKINHG